MITQIQTDQCTLLGSPITEEATESIIKSKANMISRLTKRLLKLHPHDGFYLLQKCWNTQLLNHILRTAPCFKFLEQLQEIDSIIEDCLSSLCNIKINKDTWIHASLPIKMGGIGVRSAADIAIPAYLSSLNVSTQNCNALLANSNNNWKQQLETQKNECKESLETQGFLLDQEHLNSKKQKDIDLELCKVRQSNLCQQSNHSSKIIQACSSTYASAWLSAMPVSKLGLKLTKDQLSMNWIKIRPSHNKRSGLHMWKPG